MDGNPSINLLRENDLLNNQGSKISVASEALSRNNRSKLPSYDLNRQPFFDNGLQQKIVVKFYDSHKDDFLLFDGVIQSKSENGLSFIAQRCLELETPVLIRIKTPLNFYSDDILNEGTHAQVISCLKVGDQNDGLRYRIDVEFF